MIDNKKKKYHYDETKLNLIIHKTSGNEILCHCPFHNDTNANSFYFNRLTGLYKCFACGVAGTIFDLCAETRGEVKRIYGSISQHKIDNVDWRGHLPAPVATNNKYLNEVRGITNETIATFDIRQTKNSIVFPLRNVYGEIIGLQERKVKSVAQKVRYIERGIKPSVVPLEHLGKTDALFIVEGMFGVLNAYQQDVCAVTCLGSQGFNRVSLEILKSACLDGQKVVSCFDNDDAGLLGVARILIMSDYAIGTILPGCEADEIDNWGDYLTKPVCYSLAEIRTLHSNAVVFDEAIVKIKKKESYYAR